MRGRSQSKRRWIWIIDVIAVLLMFGAFYVFASTALYAIVGTFGEFGNYPCDCEELESELESIDWLGTGQGIRFRTPGIVDEAFQEEGFEFEASQWVEEYSPEDAEILIARFADEPGMVEVTEFHNGTALAAFRHGQVVISVDANGSIDVNGPEDVGTMTTEIQELGDTLGRVPRPVPLFEELLLTDYLYWAYGISVVTLIVVFVWFLIRIVGFFRRRKSTPPPEVA
jgi:hypothetical protein